MTGELGWDTIGERDLSSRSPGQPTLHVGPSPKGETPMDAYSAQLQSFDSVIADAIRGEERRQSDGVEMNLPR